MLRPHAQAHHDAIAEAQKEASAHARAGGEGPRSHGGAGRADAREGAKVAGYLERDLKDAASYIAETGEGLREWWRFDLKLMEDRMLEIFASVADQTSLQLREWAEQARQAPAYRTGEITGPGTLVCEGCGEGLTFVKAGRIPPCPKCGGPASSADRPPSPETVRRLA